MKIHNTLTHSLTKGPNEMHAHQRLIELTYKICEKSKRLPGVTATLDRDATWKLLDDIDFLVETAKGNIRLADTKRGDALTIRCIKGKWKDTYELHLVNMGRLSTHESHDAAWSALLTFQENEKRKAVAS